MNSDDPFSNKDGDRTIIRPMPGGRGGRSVQGTQSSSQFSSKQYEDALKAGYNPGSSPPKSPILNSGLAPIQISGSGLNPLIDASTSLLNLAAQLRKSIAQDNVLALREHIVQQLHIFEEKARSNGCSQEAVLTARYLLCALLDESVLSTPWGSESDYASQSLLSTFHNETWGGEKFFQILDKLIRQSPQHLDVLELIYICLCFGFQGKYSVSERGTSTLDEIQENLFREIRAKRGDFERELSPHWTGVTDQRHTLVRYVPLWVVGALSGVLLLIVYASFRFILGSTVEPIYEEFNQIKNEPSIQLNE